MLENNFVVFNFCFSSEASKYFHWTIHRAMHIVCTFAITKALYGHKNRMTRVKIDQRMKYFIVSCLLEFKASGCDKKEKLNGKKERHRFSY